jgi:hypothetical protein
MWGWLPGSWNDHPDWETVNLWTRRLIGWSAIAAPALHTLTDLLEGTQGGFSQPQLWLNYAAFVPVPAILIGLYAAQRPHISGLGLAGALSYGFAFVYFAHTTLVALSTHAPDYEALWSGLGGIYTLHGAVMVVGGAAFGWAALRAAVVPRWTAAVFLVGVVVNFVLALLPVPDLLQTVGTTLRNVGLIGMGWSLSLATPPNTDV